jgi:hypothetical protein
MISNPPFDMFNLPTPTNSAEQFINEQLQLRLDLIYNPMFVQQCIQYVQSIGMTAQQWNQNALGIMMLIANEVVAEGQKANSI